MDFDFYRATMLATFGSAWKPAILPLSANQVDLLVHRSVANLGDPCVLPLEKISDEDHQRVQAVMRKVARPMAWNDWQKIFSSHVALMDFDFYRATMLATFGSAWKPAILPLSADQVDLLVHRSAAKLGDQSGSDRKVAELLDHISHRGQVAMKELLLHLQKPMPWNDWQKIFAGDASCRVFHCYCAAMEASFGTTWTMEIEKLEGSQVAELVRCLAGKSTVAPDRSSSGPSSAAVFTGRTHTVK